MLIMAIAAFGLLFFTCEVGERATAEYIIPKDMIAQFKWYSFPIEVQRILPIIFIIVQDPAYMGCFGSIKCLRESFKKVSDQH